MLGDKVKPYLQGWALVENPTDEDWSGVKMALISGRPISFKMDLYNPLYVDRPVVEPELFASLRPVAYSRGFKSDRVGRIIIEGNTVTQDRVILNQLDLRPGQILQYPKLEECRMRLNRLGIFDADNPPTVTAIPNNMDGSVKDILIRVKETRVRLVRHRRQRELGQGRSALGNAGADAAAESARPMNLSAVKSAVTAGAAGRLLRVRDRPPGHPPPPEERAVADRG